MIGEALLILLCIALGGVVVGGLLVASGYAKIAAAKGRLELQRTKTVEDDVVHTRKVKQLQHQKELEVLLDHNAIPQKTGMTSNPEVVEEDPKVHKPKDKNIEEPWDRKEMLDAYHNQRQAVDAEESDTPGRPFGAVVADEKNYGV